MATKSIPERLTWAVDTLAVEPSDRVLEIGCGRGVAVALVCERLGGGTITAVDRSEKAIEAARQRNAACEAAGKARFQTAALEDADFDDGSFDKIFAINVNLFWVRSPAKELAALRRWLAPGGGVYLFWEPPGAGRAVQIADTVAPVVQAHGFTAEALTGVTSTGAHLVCIAARPR